MKRILCAALALTLLGSTAAQARGWGGGGHHGGGWHGGGWHHGGYWRGDAALGFGLGFLTLGILADQDRYDRDRARADYDREYYEGARGYGRDRDDDGAPGDRAGYGDRDDRGGVTGNGVRDNGVRDNGGPDGAGAGAYDRDDDRGPPPADHRPSNIHPGGNVDDDDDGDQ